MIKEEVSVVIPTRNRKEEIAKLLDDLSLQTYPIKEVIIVDASDERMNENNLKTLFPLLPITFVTSHPSVCIQRNLGIVKAKAPYVFLCDDDISLSPDYVASLMKEVIEKRVGAVSGLILQKNKTDEWVYEYPPNSLSHLLYAFVFQQSVWGDVFSMNVNLFVKPFYILIKRFYRQRENTLSLAGWPIITHFSGPVFQTKTYGLGASIIKRDWLLNFPYEEVLDPHGIGDNYGVAIGFPQPIHVIKSAKAYHHHSSENRLDQSVSYFRRVLALHYFLKTKKKFSWWNRLWFSWSIFGNMVFHKDQAFRNASSIALKLVLLGKNPYAIGTKNGSKCVSPTLD